MSGAAFAGVDGCRGGWIAVIHQAGDEPRAMVSPTFAEIAARMPNGAAIAVDMPIGLPDRTGAKGRGPERAVRPLLGERQSSVFSIPSRPAVYADDYASACALAAGTSDPPRRVSKQAFHIFPKIRELDAVLRADPALAERVIEAHPEAAFWRLNGKRPMQLPKKVRGRNNPAGLLERSALLERCGYAPDFLAKGPPKGAAADDFLDAAAVALIAQRYLRGEARPFPDPFERDAHGLRMAIWT